MIDNKFIFKDYAKELKKALDLVDQEQLDKLYSVFDSYFGINANIYLLGNGEQSG